MWVLLFVLFLELWSYIFFLIETIACCMQSAYSLIFTRALYNAVSQAIFNPARQLLWLPFNENERGRFQNFVCGPFRSLSRIFGAVLSMVLTATIVVHFIGTSSTRYGARNFSFITM